MGRQKSTGRPLEHLPRKVPFAGSRDVPWLMGTWLPFIGLVLVLAFGASRANAQPPTVILEIHEVYTKRIDVTQSDENVIVTFPVVWEYITTSTSYITEGKQYDVGNGIYFGPDRFDLDGRLYTLPRGGRAVGISKIVTPAPGEHLLTLSFDPGFFSDGVKPGNTFEEILGVEVIKGLSTAFIDTKKGTVTISKRLHILMKLNEARIGEFRDFLKGFEAVDWKPPQ